VAEFEQIVTVLQIATHYLVKSVVKLQL